MPPQVAEMAVQFFITNDKARSVCSPRRAAQPLIRAQPNVAGVILAGSADFKTELSQSDLFDLRHARLQRSPRAALSAAPAQIASCHRERG
jgi:hypothetical protein